MIEFDSYAFNSLTYCDDFVMLLAKEKKDSMFEVE